MTLDGFYLTAYDGQSVQGGPWNNFLPPEIIDGFRPDACGYDAAGRLAVAEAKTAPDVDTQHTRRQLRVLTQLATADHPVRLYVAIPRSAAPALDKVLSDLHLVGAPQIVRLHIPDVLLEAAS